MDPIPQIRKGEYLLPGSYEFEDITDRIARMKVTYGFKGPDRESLLEKSLMGIKDKVKCISIYGLMNKIKVSIGKRIFKLVQQLIKSKNIFNSMVNQNQFIMVFSNQRQKGAYSYREMVHHPAAMKCLW